MNFKSFQESKTGTLKKLEKAAALSASEKPEDQDRAREYRVAADFKSWRNQKRSGKLKEGGIPKQSKPNEPYDGGKPVEEEVGISSAAAMKKAREEALLRKKEQDAVKKEKEALKKEEVQVDEVYKKLPVAKMAKKISDKSFKSGQSGVSTKSAEQTGKMIGVLDTHDPQRSKAKSKIKEAKVDQGLDDEGKEDARNYRKFGTKHNQHKTAVFRRELHRSRRGDKKVKGRKEPANAYESKWVEESDQAFKNVVSFLQKKHGKDGVITKDNPPKPPTEEQKKAAAKRRAEIASQDKRDQREKETQGRYSSKYSNVGSD